MQQWSCGSQQYNQEWQFQSEGNGAYSIVNRNAPAEVLDVANVGTANGSLLQLWTYGGGSNQQWTPVVARQRVLQVRRCGQRALSRYTGRIDGERRTTADLRLQRYGSPGVQADGAT